MRDSIPLVWSISAASAIRHHDCTIRGIQSRCGASCCKIGSYWPPSSGRPLGLDSCPALTPNGCRFGIDRPLTCHLYPLILNPSGKWVLHNRATYQKGLCKGAHNEGPRIIDLLGDSLVRLFGTGAALSIRAEVLSGRDPYFMPPIEIVEAYKNELALEASMLPPQPIPRLINP